MDYPTMSDAQREEWQQVNDALNEAKRQHDRALRDYETTPAGQRDLADAADRLEADGDAVGAERARQRLAEAKAARQQQVADLAASQEYAARMASVSEEEAGAIRRADNAAMLAVRAFDRAQDVLDDRKQELRDYRSLNRRTLTVDGSPEQEEEHRLALAVKQAQMEVEDAERTYNTAVDSQDKCRALVGSGVGLNAAPVDLARAGNQIVRQPDGSVNAHVYRAPSPGFPNGRYLRATGVKVIWGSAPGNALVLEDGTEVYANEHYYRNHLGAHLDGNSPEGVIITRPHDGARPLREEGVPEAGFLRFIDSTD